MCAFQRLREDDSRQVLMFTQQGFCIAREGGTNERRWSRGRIMEGREERGGGRRRGRERKE
jgi:hypothetical protein